MDEKIYFAIYFLEIRPFWSFSGLTQNFWHAPLGTPRILKISKKFLHVIEKEI